MPQIVQPVRPHGARLPSQGVRRLAWAWAWAQARPRPVAAVAAALVMSLALFAGALDGLERRVSDSWFGLSNRAPSGHTVLVTFDYPATRPGSSMRMARHDLAALLLKLDAAGAERILIEGPLAEPGNNADDGLLEGVLAQLDRKVAMGETAVVAPDQKSRRRTAPLAHFAHPPMRTRADLGPDRDGAIRRIGVRQSRHAKHVASPAWLDGVQRYRAGAPQDFHIDFGIDLARIPRLEAASVLRGRTEGLAGARVIVDGYAPRYGRGLRVPRYGELTPSEVTALAAESLALGRALHAVPFALSTLALILLAALLAYWCVPRKARAAACLCGAVALGGMGLGAALQIFAGIIAPAVGVAVAAVLGCVAAQVVVHPRFQRLRQGAATVLTNVDVARLNRIASQDVLTGVANRRGFDEALQRACAGGEGQFALLLCDLDRFKEVNDTMGHKAGDALLQAIAARLVGATGSGGLVARLGGDEFAILLAPATQSRAAETARRVVDALAQPIALGGRSVRVGISIGIALGASGGDAAALIEAADAAMYAAKRGRTGYGFADAPSAGSSPLEATAAASEPGAPETARLYAPAGL